ncbi:hypothetical protein MMC13_007919 [Lambiella insularis]|nr:hypothetical protein [Lambiella insularis]
MLLSLTLELEALARKAEYTEERFRSTKAQPTKEEYHGFESLSLRFSEVAARFSNQVDQLRGEYVDWAEGEGQRLASRAESACANLIADGQPKSVATFRRNLTLIFQGPVDSALDSSSIRSRNKQTRKRCERIRCLTPGGILSWAAAFPPTDWTAGFMNDRAFDYLVDEIEPKEERVWPVKLREILQTFGAEGALRESINYSQFIAD